MSGVRENAPDLSPGQRASKIGRYSVDIVKGYETNTK